MTQLAQSVQAVLRSDQVLSERMAAYDFPNPKDRFDSSTIRSVSTVATVNSLRSSVVLSFEGTLAKARVYQRAARNTSTHSFKTIITSESKWSQLSGLSLSQISDISVVRLPIFIHELQNSQLLQCNEAQTSNGSTALHKAATRGDAVTLGQLVRLGANKESKDKYGRTALHLAAYNGMNAMVSLLMGEFGVDKEAKNNDGMTALHLAADNGMNATVSLLIGEFGVDKDAKDNNGMTVLHLAAYKGQNATVSLLMGEFGADKEAKDNNGRTALHLAAYKGQNATVGLLMGEFGVNKEAKDNNGMTAVQLAACKGQNATVSLFMGEFGVDKEAKDNNGRTALHLAAYKGQNATVSLLVAGSPKVHDRDCLIRLHAMTALLDFTRCSPSCSSYIRRTFVRLSCTYNQLTHSLQQVMSPAVATD